MSFKFLAAALAASATRWRCQRPSSCEAKKPERQRVLVIGAGLTGCLTAALLRRKSEVQIEVWERASYPAGRFGAGMAVPGGVWADLGAQVLSVVDVQSGHPNAGADGHNVQSEDVHTAWREVRELEASGMLQRVPDEALGDTEERMKYDGLWSHFRCPQGFGRLLRRYLDEADVNLKLGTRADVVHISSAASAAKRPSEEDAHIVVQGVRPAVDGMRREKVSSAFDLVISAVPAPEALRLLRSSLPPGVVRVLQDVEYDRRLSLALALDPCLADAAAQIFGSTSELTEDLDTSKEGCVHLLSLQNCKQPELAHGDPVVIVAHSTCGVEGDKFADEVFRILAERFGLSAAVLKSLVSQQKVVDWDVCQMTRPLEALDSQESKDLKLGRPCFAYGPLIVAGDFWCQSSFLGCFCSASAAAAKAVDLLNLPQR